MFIAVRTGLEPFFFFSGAKISAFFHMRKLLRIFFAAVLKFPYVCHQICKKQIR